MLQFFIHQKWILYWKRSFFLLCHSCMIDIFGSFCVKKYFCTYVFYEKVLYFCKILHIFLSNSQPILSICTIIFISIFITWPFGMFDIEKGSKLILNKISLDHSLIGCIEYVSFVPLRNFILPLDRSSITVKIVCASTSCQV